MPGSQKRQYGILALALTLVFLIPLIFFTGYHPYLLVVASLCATGFLMYGADKWAAIRRAGRVPEAVLLTLGLAGGFPGCLFGMMLFRHKIRKWYFWAINIGSVLPHMYLTRYLGLWPEGICFPLPWPF